VQNFKATFFPFVRFLGVRIIEECSSEFSPSRSRVERRIVSRGCEVMGAPRNLFRFLFLASVRRTCRQSTLLHSRLGGCLSSAILRMWLVWERRQHRRPRSVREMLSRAVPCSIAREPRCAGGSLIWSGYAGVLGWEPPLKF
jgi:hypothetical protein